MRIQLRDSVETALLLSLSSKILSMKFFDVLRTQEQLGYIGQLGDGRAKMFDYLIAVIQTEYAPDYTRGRINAFLDEKLANAGDAVGEEEFETCRAGLLSDLKMVPK